MGRERDQAARYQAEKNAHQIVFGVHATARFEDAHRNRFYGYRGKENRNGEYGDL